MRRTLPLVLVGGLATLTWAPGSSAVETCLLSSCPGRLTFTLNGRASPAGLPRLRYAPVAAEGSGRIATTDGTHPSALREVEFGIDEDVRLNIRGFPACKEDQLMVDDIKMALKACRAAVVGEGGADYELVPPVPVPPAPRILNTGLDNLLPSLPLVIFNGGEKRGKVVLLVFADLPVPGTNTIAAAPASAVGKIVLDRKGGGVEGVARLPAIAGGYGSLLDFSLELGKAYRHRGKKVGYFEAKCPDGVFKVTTPKVIFKNEAHSPGVASSTTLKGSLAVPCTPKG
jgi:hypothetical protein